MSQTVKPVTLTFDNGPDPDITPRILDILATRGILTTFFVLGKHLADPARKEIARRAHAAGHWIGNHTYHHAGQMGLDPDPGVAAREIGETQSLIADLSHPARYFRPCGGGGKIDSGLFRDRDRRFLVDGRYSCVLWNAVPGDWLAGDEWVETALGMFDETAWPLFVLHDMPDACIGRLEYFLDTLIGKGVEFRQAFPADCVVMSCGEPTGSVDFDTLVRAA